MRLTQSSITINQSHFLCGSWSFFTLLACVLVSVCMCVCVFVCIHFADMQAGGHPSRRQAGEGGKRGGGCMRAVVQKYREELLLALAVSAVAVARPKQLQSIHPHLPLPLHPTSPLLLIPLRFHPTSKEVCDMASAELAGRLELLHLGPSTVSYRVNIQQGSWKAKQLCPFSFFLRVLSSSIRYSGSLTHASMLPATSPPFPFLGDHGATDCVIATFWHCWTRHLRDGQNLPWQMLPQTFL